MRGERRTGSVPTDENTKARAKNGARPAAVKSKILRQPSRGDRELNFPPSAGGVAPAAAFMEERFLSEATLEARHLRARFGDVEIHG